MVYVSVPPKPEKFWVYADDHGNVHFNWSAVTGATGYTVYWCHHHRHMKQCSVWITSYASFWMPTNYRMSWVASRGLGDNWSQKMKKWKF